jgi:hypothetical protein
MASAQTGPMLTPSAFIEAPGYFGLDILGLTIGKEPNYLTYAQSGALQLRTRIDGPVFRFQYVPSERAEFAAEVNAQTFAINDPRYGKTISDIGDATLRAKLGLLKGERSASPAVAFQIEMTLPNTSFGNGLGPNTIRLASTLLLGYQTEKFTLNGSAGVAIQDEPLRAHEQRDFASLSGSIAYRVSENLEIFGDTGGYFGDGVPGAIARREARLGVQNHRTLFGRPTSIYLAGRRGLVTFQGKWGVVFGLTTAVRQGVTPKDRVPEIPPMVDGTIAGIVTSSQFTPQPGAEVSLRTSGDGTGAGPGMSGQSTLTDGEGRFRFEHLPPSRYQLSAALGSTASPVVEVSLYAGETREYLRLELKGAAGLAIEAREAKMGSGLRSVFARVQEGTRDVFSGLVSLDSEGRGEIPGIPPGNYTVLAQAPGYAPLRVPDVKAPSMTLHLTLTQGGTVEIRTTANFIAARPRSAQIVSVSGAPMSLEQGGPNSFALSTPIQRFENLAPGSYRLTLEGGVEKTFEIVEGGIAIVDIP